MTAVVPYIAPTTSRPSWLEVMDRGVELAEIIANTDFVPRGLRGNQPAILAAILYGHEVGLEPMQSLAHISVIDGRPTMSAEAQRALILAQGHELYPEEVTNTRATMVGRRRDSRQTVRVTWTLDDAKRARISGKPAWQAYPRQMLIARATAELARQLFADVIGGLAATEELDDADTTPPTPDSTPEPEQKKTRRRARIAAAAPPPDVPEPEPEQTPEPDPVDPKAIRKMFALYNDKGFGGASERNRRLAFAEEALGRKIQSSNELTNVEVSRIIEALQELPDAPKPESTSTFEAPPGALEGTLPEAERTLLDELESELDARPVDDPPPLPDDDR